MLYAIAMGHK